MAELVYLTMYFSPVDGQLVYLTMYFSRVDGQISVYCFLYFLIRLNLETMASCQTR